MDKLLQQTKEEVGRREREVKRVLQESFREKESDSVHGGRKEIYSMDGFRGRRKLSDGERQETDSRVGRQHLVPKKGQEFVSYVKK